MRYEVRHLFFKSETGLVVVLPNKDLFLSSDASCFGGLADFGGGSLS